MVVTLSVQTEIEYDPMDPESYDEKLSELVNELEDMNLSVSVEKEEDPEEDEGFETEEDTEEE
jgi:hypothetical protein